MFIIGGVNLELFGQVVKHKNFGRGQIVEFVNSEVTVLFDDCKIEKKFTYPWDFGSLLELESKSFFKQIEEDKENTSQEK